MTVTRGSFRFSDAPMQRDRTAGWRFVREAGDVFQDVDGTWYLTSLEAVRFAHRSPDIFSSARAFDELGSPVPLIPLAIDPPDHVRYRGVLDQMLAPHVVNALEDDLRAQIRDLIAAFSRRGRCDVGHVPSQVAASRLSGVHRRAVESELTPGMLCR